jgi:Bacteriophage tail sheath protein
MPITPSYPGIYIEELPSSAHTITAAPTSIAVFVGYTHPLKTKAANFGKAVEIFSFADYEREFGGLYVNKAVNAGTVLDANVAYAVNDFFLNGGSDAFVVALKPQYRNAGGTGTAIAGAHAASNGIGFTALEPTDAVHMSVAIQNVAANIADIVVTYQAQTEAFRKVTLDSSKPDFLDKRINGLSSLITVAPSPTYPVNFTAATVNLSAPAPAGTVGVFNVGDFAPVFAADSSLDKLPIFNLLILPGIENTTVLSDGLAFCERKLAFLIMDPPAVDTADPGANWIGDYIDNTAPKSTNGALYFPYLNSNDPTSGAPIKLPPGGFTAGIFARTDTDRGVWKAPAGLETIVLSTAGVVDSGRMTDPRHGVLNLKGVNCLRSLPGIGTVVFGARTLVSANVAFQQWKYVPVRRMALFIEQTLRANLGWVIFEPNDEPLWVAIRTSIENFMLSLFNQGAFQGTKPSEAFQVKCDSSTTTQDDINNGIVNIIVAFAPLKPAEFVIIKIAQLAGQAQA